MASARFDPLLDHKPLIHWTHESTGAAAAARSRGTANVAFDDLVDLVEAFGFRLSRIRGSHHIFVQPEIPELVNLQEVRGQAKPYQTRQFLRLVERHNLSLEEDA